MILSLLKYRNQTSSEERNNNTKKEKFNFIEPFSIQFD